MMVSAQYIHKILTLANGVTILRVLLLPGFVIAFLYGGKSGLWTATAFAVFFELTDSFDGFLARRFSLVSSVGKLLDPLADTLCRFTIFLTFMSVGLLPLWMIIILFFRDMIVAYIRVGAALMNVVMASRTSGKIKAIIQAIGIFVALAALLMKEHGIAIFPAETVIWWAMLIVVGITTYSLIDYLYGFLSLPAFESQHQEGTKT